MSGPCLCNVCAVPSRPGGEPCSTTPTGMFVLLRRPRRRSSTSTSPKEAWKMRWWRWWCLASAPTWRRPRRSSSCRRVAPNAEGGARWELGWRRPGGRFSRGAHVGGHACAHMRVCCVGVVNATVLVNASFPSRVNFLPTEQRVCDPPERAGGWAAGQAERGGRRFDGGLGPD